MGTALPAGAGVSLDEGAGAAGAAGSWTAGVAWLTSGRPDSLATSEVTKNSLYNHRSAHVLGIGVGEFVSADGDVADIARAIRRQGALAIAAHPVWTRKMEKQTFHIWDHRRELEGEFDAWEVASGPFIFDEVASTAYPKIASSDLHHARQLTSWKTVLDCERHPEAILAAIREQRIDFRFYEAKEEEYAPVVAGRRRTVDFQFDRPVLGNLARA